MRHFLIALFCLASGQAAAAGRPLAPRELVHPYPPAGPVEIAGTPVASKVLRTVQHYSAPAFTDLLAAHVAQTLQAASDEPVAVTRKIRQSGFAATIAVSSAPADGRTLLLASRIPALSAPESSMGAPDSVRPVALVATMPFVIVASGESKHASLRDLIREAQRAPDRLLVAGAGETSVARLAIELLHVRHGLRIEPVPYNGGNAALQAVATRQVDAALVPLPLSVAAYPRRPRQNTGHRREAAAPESSRRADGDRGRPG